LVWPSAWPMTKILRVERTMALATRGLATNTSLASRGRSTMTDVFVPEAFTVRRDLDSERRIDDPFFQFSTTSAYSSGFAAVSMGIARSMMDELRALAMQKTPSHTGRALRDNPVMHHLIAEHEAKLRSIRAFVLEAIRDAEDCIRRTGTLDMESRVMLRLSTTTAIQQAKKVAEFAYHEAGATAIFARNPFERKMRDIHASAQQVQGGQRGGLAVQVGHGVRVIWRGAIVARFGGGAPVGRLTEQRRQQNTTKQSDEWRAEIHSRASEGLIHLIECAVCRVRDIC